MSDTFRWLLCLFLSETLMSTHAQLTSVMEDAKLPTTSLISKYGYPAEIHTVTTDDGYILELHRIPRPKAIPVLLVHGLFDSSATWVMMGPEKGLAYLLYEENYDIWMANVRGNTYSKNHTSRTTEDAEFWDFTFHEMGVYDIPNTIDYVLANTSSTQLHYIGHSQGTVVFWVMGSERPEYMDKIILMQAMAPVAYLSNAKSPAMNFLVQASDSINYMLNLLGLHEFMPRSEFSKSLSNIICDQNTLSREICSNLLFLFTGFDRYQLNSSMLPVIIGHTPAGASTKQMQHYAQIKKDGIFQQYDYGELLNGLHYANRETPPEYKLSNVRAKVALYHGQNDWLSEPVDVTLLHRKLPNVVYEYLVEYPSFNHMDFIWGIDAFQLVWKRMFDKMKYYDNEKIWKLITFNQYL